MKKSQVLGLSVAIAGNMALMMPQTASAAITCTATSTAAGTTTCSGSGGYTQENVNFTGSKGVVIGVSDTSTEFAACAYHLNGGKSFGMSTSSTAMTIRSSTGSTAASGTGCS